jgi:hypothetical protein
MYIALFSISCERTSGTWGHVRARVIRKRGHQHSGVYFPSQENSEMKRRRSILLGAALLAAVTFGLAACSKTATNSNNSNATTNTTNTGTANSTTTPTTTSNASSPTDVLKQSYDAAKRKDVAGFKKTIASADLKQIEEILKRSGKTLDDSFREQLEHPDAPMPDTLETRDEKINGDKATVEYKNVQGTWKTASLIKENGEWKIKLNDAEPDEAASPTEPGAMNEGEHEKGEH